jgi:hypothetical protein
MTGNGTAYIRIDVIECQPITDPNPETDNRDVFNPVTGLFTPTNLPKSQDQLMQYRVRAGTPAGGFPGVVSGWLPLAVASVPPGTTTNDTITFWDVRPLVTDRVFDGSPMGVALPRRPKALYSGNTGGGTAVKTAGFAEAWLGNQRLGGNLLRGSPGVDAQYVDFADSANQENAFAPASTNAQLVYYYLVLPFGLPRWSRYTDASSGVRMPRSPRGIPMASLVPPTHVTGVASLPIQFPAVFGFGFGQTSNQQAVLFGASTANNTASYPQVTADGHTDLNTPITLPINFAGSLSGGGLVGIFTMPENVQFPAGCSKITVKLGIKLTVAATVTYIAPMNLTIQAAIQGQETDNFSTAVFTGVPLCVTNGETTSSFFIVDWIGEVRLPNAYPATVPQTYSLSYAITGNDFSDADLGSPAAPLIQVLGWELSR